MRLIEKAAIITGAGRGLGRAAALRFCQEGAAVAVAELDSATGEETAAWLRQKGDRAQFIRVDVSDSQSAAAVVESAVERFGQVDIVVNNAGITMDATLMKMTEEQFDRVIAPHMAERGYGLIINTSSVVGLYGNFGQTNYAATRAGVIGMTMTWARELGRKGLTVNAVAPGFIMTDMVAKIPEKVIVA